MYYPLSREANLADGFLGGEPSLDVENMGTDEMKRKTDDFSNLPGYQSKYNR